MAFGIKALKPEIDQPKYYTHIIIVTLIAYFFMKLIWHTDLFADGLTLMNLIKLSIATTVGDIVAHTLLHLD